MSHDFYRLLLKVVRRKPVLFTCDECFKKSPCLAGDLPQKKFLIICQQGFTPDWHFTYPPYYCRRSNPKERDGPDKDQGQWPPESQTYQSDKCKKRSHPHGFV